MAKPVNGEKVRRSTPGWQFNIIFEQEFWKEFWKELWIKFCNKNWNESTVKKVPVQYCRGNPDFIGTNMPQKLELVGVHPYILSKVISFQFSFQSESGGWRNVRNKVN